MNVLIRADASLDIGSGHIMRCLTLANAIKTDGGIVEFACKEHPGNLIDRIISQSFDTHTLSLDPCDNKNWLGGSWQNDANACAKILNQKSYDWVIVDHYEIDSQWQSHIRPLVKKLLVIDDLANRKHDCDILLDQNIPLPGHNYSELVNDNTCILHGPQYCLLRPEFLRDYPPQEGSDLTAVVFLGGADQQNLTEAIVQQLALMKNISANVVLGGQNQRAKYLTQLCRSLGFKCHINITNMAELIAQSDIVIAACGFTCYETASMKKPALLIPLSDIQAQVAYELEKLGVAKAIEPKEINSNTFLSAIMQLKNTDEEAFSLFKNDGSKIIIQHMKEGLRT